MKQERKLLPRDVRAVPLARVVVSKENVRQNIGDLTDLKVSMQDRGLLQAIVVREAPDGLYEVIAGRRRYEAARELGWDKITALIKLYDSGSDGEQSARDDSWAENERKMNMTLSEKAVYLQACVEYFRSKGMASPRKIHSAVSEHVGMPWTKIEEILTLGGAQSAFETVVFGEQETPVIEGKPIIRSLNAVKKLVKAVNDPAVKEKLAILSPETQQKQRNGLALEIASRPDKYGRIIEAFKEDPVRPVPESAAKALRDTIDIKGETRTIYFPNSDLDVLRAIARYQAKFALPKESTAIVSMLRKYADEHGLLNQVTYPPLEAMG